jgi:NAD(P)-dependent dehydrogenase (short-subunit alcohol dehydrogenase family)
MNKESILKNFGLENKVIILTGSAGRLGKNFANTLSDVGANVVLVDIETKKNKELEKSISKKYGTDPLACTIDISKKQDIMKLKNDVLRKYKKIDGLVNNAFYSPRQNIKKSASSFEKFSLDLWNKVIAINLTGVFLCSQEIGKVMIKQKSGGVIVNISSIYGINGADQRIYGASELNSPPSYAVTKGAIVNFTRYLAAYWTKKNIRVNTLTLGGVIDESYMNKQFINKYSEKTILGRMAQENEYNGSLLFLLSNASSYMTGSNLVVDGGWTAW